MSEHKPHSGEFFGDYRDFWWNKDFLELIAKRFGLRNYKKILDVGCGVGHWSAIIAPLLHPDFHLTGLDKERQWVEKAKDIKSLVGRTAFIQGDATKLPFENETFDLVTCQTVLIHMGNPAAVLTEMKRVLKPGGRILVAEPNNAMQNMAKSTETSKEPIEAILRRAAFRMRIERGKIALGCGDNSLGDLVPGLFRAAGLSNIQVYISDKAVPLLPPYDTAEQKALISTIEAWVTKEVGIENRDFTKKCFMAAGGTETDFETEFAFQKETSVKMLQAVRAGLYDDAGGCMMYLVSGVKN